ncbi:periplasmic heavy metal sensor [Fluoribacter gormanii]|uniref:Spy/CpxP family protein refolding chaperone n=1 Tax=Fluoribacter gormanii TaxID=464 RepID=UPI0022449291|nr:periplasmic heavy metal sensor [Fluoribacter gormanii]MCW8472350.1 periplasmic heavy metal sensor [Fluoribacter gormanii]
MNLKKYLVIGALVSSLGGVSVANAHMPPGHGCQNSPPKISKLVPEEQRAEFKAMLKDMHAQMQPLMKEKHALHMQLMGLVATPGAHWEDISSVMDKLIANNAATTKLVTKNQFEMFHKFGVLLPPPPGAPDL